MNFDSIYSLCHGGTRGELVVNPIDLPYEKRLLIANGTWRPEQPLKFVQHMGNRKTDFLLCGISVVNLISHRFQDLLLSNQFTGWTNFSVDIQLKDGAPLNGFHGLSITGRCGPIDNSKSERKTIPAKWPAVQAIPAWYGLYFDLSTWDGRDLFMPEGTGYIFITEAVKSALEEAKLSNLHFDKLTDVERLVL